eukprot:9469919-Pyramimonas_sp.AAC.1
MASTHYSMYSALRVWIDVCVMADNAKYHAQDSSAVRHIRGVAIFSPPNRMYVTTIVVTYDDDYYDD